VFGRVRRVFVEIGRRFHDSDLLENARDIFYLQVGEILAFVNGTAVTTKLKDLVALRKRQWEEFRNQPAPPDRFETRGPVYQGNAFLPIAPTEDTTAAVEERVGLGCCPGKVRGQVCVVANPREASLVAGKILVAERTDPGWILLFPMAAGLIVERGNLLSHSAIVSRELGIPCVVSLSGATQWLRDGDLVELDGGKGIVRRLVKQEAHAA
jgi:phosphohistidine swiveling domain-containing protein